MVPHTSRSELRRALARIDAKFSVAARCHIHKRRVRAIMRAGVEDPEATRYQRVVEQMPRDIQLTAAIILSERFYRMEVYRRERIERTWGFCHEPRITLMALDELRLMLRWSRRFAPAAFVQWRDHLNQE